jgi:hypothetical protein
MKSKGMINIYLFLIALLAIHFRCEYDGPTAMYNHKHAATTPPVISGLEPSSVAPAGYNYLKILGENFDASPEKNFVYFNTVPAEVVNSTTTAITVRRPNQTGDSLTVMVATLEAIEIGEYGPYKVEPVYAAYGQLVETDKIGSVAVDADENVYFTQAPRDVFKVQPDGTTTLLGSSSRAVTDSRVGPGGKLVMLMAYRRIYAMDLATGEETEWANVGEAVSYGDFDEYGNFYAGGEETDLITIKPDTTFSKLGVYMADTIACVRVYDRYVYLLVKPAAPDDSNPAVAIWRHKIQNANGSLSARELVLDLLEMNFEAGTQVYDFTFSDDGILLIGTDNSSPLITYNVESNEQDIFYKGILPPAAHNLVWGNGNYIYVAQGGENWSLVRIDVGGQGATYYGRNL